MTSRIQIQRLRFLKSQENRLISLRQLHSTILPHSLWRSGIELGKGIHSWQKGEVAWLYGNEEALGIAEVCHNLAPFSKKDKGWAWSMVAWFWMNQSICKFSLHKILISIQMRKFKKLLTCFAFISCISIGTFACVCSNTINACSPVQAAIVNAIVYV